MLLRGLFLGGASENGHVEDDEREGDEHDDARYPVERKRHDKQHDGDDDERAHLGQNEAEVRFNLVDAFEHRRRHASRAVFLHELGLRGEYLAQKLGAQRIGLFVGVAVHEAVLRIRESLLADEASEEQCDPERLVGQGASVPEVRDRA